MNQQRPTAIHAVLLAAAGYWVASGDPTPPAPAPGPAPNPADVQQLRSAFGEAGQADCVRFAALCNAIGGRLDADTKLPADRRRLKTSGALNDFRRQVREDYLGDSLTGKYPLLTDFLRQFFASRVGEFDEKLGDPQRAAWSAAFRDLAAAALEASQ